MTAQVGIGTTTPVASSMLDIQSTSKGVLIPRMTTIQRATISSPANGLLVFDTVTKSFWFYNVDAWKELVSGSSIVDADGDTKIVVEKTSDEDKIHFSTANAAGTASVERMTIDNAGNTRIGDGTNNTYIESDGSLSYEGTATRWEDLKVPVNTVKTSSGWFSTTDSADWDGFLGGTQLIWFTNGTDADAVYFTVQMPHAWKEGSTIMPHVHWTNNFAPGTQRVTWVLEYTWANPGGSFGATTEVTGTNVGTGDGTIAQYEHAITRLGTNGISATGKTLSSMLICKLSRKASAGTDTFTRSAALMEIDFHYQIDSDGSRTEYTK